MTSTTRTELDEQLLQLLNLVNDWLKFAEAKNVGMVGLSSGALLFLLGYVAGNADRMSFSAVLAVVIGAVGLLLALVTNLTSFLPRLHIGPHQPAASSPRPTPNDNLYFYGHIARYAPSALVAEVARRHVRTEDVDVDTRHIELAQQVVTNAQITLRKLRLFSYSVVSFGVGVVACAVGVLVATLT